MFKPINYDSGKTTTLLSAATTTITKGDALDFSSGLAQRATASSTQIKYVALEDVASTGTSLPVLAVSTIGVKFEADCTHVMAQSYIGTIVDLTDHANLDNDAAATDYAFEIESGVTGVKKCKGYFHQSTAN